MPELGNHEDMKTALLALLAQNGGSIDVGFEELGEAALTQKAGDVAVAVERTATGARYFMTESSTAKILRGLGRG